jgi:hypothetical protein
VIEFPAHRITDTAAEAWGKARANRQVAFQKLEAAYRDENESQSRHLSAHTTQADMERFVFYRRRVLTAREELEIASAGEQLAFMRWSGWQGE